MNKIAKDKRKWLAYGSVGAALAGVGLWQYLPAALAESAGSTKKKEIRHQRSSDAGYQS